MRILALIFTCIYLNFIALPVLNTCFCQQKSSTCKGHQNSKATEVTSSCCSKSETPEPERASKKCCGFPKSECRTDCPKIAYLIDRENANIVTDSNFYSFIIQPATISAHVSPFDLSKIIKKPPGRINLAIHIHSTVLQC